MNADSAFLSFGIVCAPAQELAAFYAKDRMPMWCGSSSIRCRTEKGTLNELVHRLRPSSTTFPARVVIVKLGEDDACALYEATKFGTDAGSLREISRSLSCVAIRIVENGVAPQAHATDAYKQAAIWNHIDISRGIQRSISVYKDHRNWKFETFGDVQPYEEVSYYNRRLKSERLNIVIMKEYLTRLNLDFFDDALRPVAEPLEWITVHSG